MVNYRKVVEGNVGQAMTSPVEVVTENTGIEELRSIFQNKGYFCFPVVDEDGKYKGVVTKSDLLRLYQFRRGRVTVKAIYQSVFAETVRDIMHTPTSVLSPEDTLEEAVELFLQQGVHEVVIVDKGMPVGILSVEDVLQFCVEGKEDNAS